MRTTVILAMMCVVAASQAEILNFDDVNTGGGVVVLPNPYHGYTPSSTLAVVDLTYYNSGWSNTAAFPSSPNALSNGYGRITESLTNGTLFTFDGLEAQTWTQNDQPIPNQASASLTVEGYLAGNLVNTTTMQLGTTFAHMNGFAGTLDEVRFINDGTDAHWWVVDDLVLNPVPEPAAVAVLGLGVLALLRGRRKQQ